MSNEGEESSPDEPIGKTEAELNGLGRQMTVGERIVKAVMGQRPRCAGCRK
jgi:hypothetical protein